MTFEEFIALVREDEWFREHHLKNVTQELGEAWIDFYQPDMLDFAAEGTHEFCIRFSFSIRTSMDRTQATPMAALICF